MDLSDPRKLHLRQKHQRNLNIIQGILEDSIHVYILESRGNLYDEDVPELMRTLEFSRGLRTHQMIVAADGAVRWISDGFPCDLLQDIHNALIGVEVLMSADWD